MSLMMSGAALNAHVLTVGGPQYPATFDGMKAALAAAASGDVVLILPGTAVPASLSEKLNVPYGVSLVGAGPISSSIVMPAGTVLQETIIFRGNNYIEGIAFYHQTMDASNQAGGINLCGNNHTFFNCWFDGNQDCFCLGETDGANGSMMSTSAVSSMTISGTTLSKTGTFTNYTWRSGDVAVIVAGGTSGIYTIASKTSANAVELGSAPGDSAGGATAFICSQNSQWYGGTRLINCKGTTWNFDFFKIQAAAPVGAQDITCRGCDFIGATTGQAAFIRDSLYWLDCRDCLFDGSTASTSFNMYGRNAGIIYRSAQTNASTPTALTITGGTWTQSTATLSKTAAFATYTWRQGDVAVISAGVTAGTYPILSRTSDDAIVLLGLGDGDAAGTVTAAINPGYKMLFKDSIIRTKSTASVQSLFKIVAALTAAKAGIEGVFDNVWFDVPTGCLLYKGASHATVTPKSNIILNNCRLPDGFSVSATTLPSINGSGNPTVAFRGSTRREASYAVTDAATVTIDPNLAETHYWTCTQATALNVNQNAGAYFVGQQFTVLIADAGTHNITPDGTNCKGGTVATVAGKTIAMTYRYNGTAWIQVSTQNGTAATGY